MKILVVEDEASLARDIQNFLQQDQTWCEIAANYEQACQKALLYPFDCILLDIGLPDENGLKLLRDLKKEGKEDGVLIISAKDSLDDRIKGLELGADDYITKPFHLAELNARVKAILRRKKFNASNIVELANLRLDLNNYSASVGKKRLDLTRKEFELLQHLIANHNRVLSKVSLAEYVWGESVDQAEGFDFLFAHIKNMRKKLAQAGAFVEIKSIYGVGYKMVTTCD